MVKPEKPRPLQTIGVAEFKARCLELLERVGSRGDELIVTKRGKPIARVVPIRPEVRPLKGLLAGQVKIVGDIVNVNWADEWEAAR